MSCPRVIKVCGIGLVGPAGKSILSGNGAPTVAVGTDGEFYIDLTASRLYGPKMSGAWGAGTLLKGDKGDKGDQGDPATYSNATPQPLGATASAGDDQAASRADHVHARPTAAEVGADASGTAAAAVAAHVAAADPHPGYLTPAEGNAAYATVAQGVKADTAIQPGNAALSDARTPTAHKSSHAAGGSDALSPADIGAAATVHGHAISDVSGLQTALDGKVGTSDSRLSDSREWSADTVSQGEAEAGTATTRRAFTALRVFQAIASWWNGSAAKTKLDGIASNATANSSDATLLNRANHTGTQLSSTISDLNTVLAGYQPVDSDLTALAALGTTSYGRSLLALADAAAGRTALELGTLATQSGTFSGASSGINTGDQATNLSYDATTRNLASSTGSPAVLPLFGSSSAGLVPASGGGTSNFLRADGTFAAPPGGAGTPGGSNGCLTFNDGGTFGGDVDLTYDKTTNLLTSKGDILLDDGGSFTTTLQTVTATANRTISFPDATGTVALVGGSSGQVLVNINGATGGLSTLTADGSGNLTLSARLTNSFNAAANAPAKLFSGTWFTGGTSTTTKPHVLIEPSGTTSTGWSTAGTGFGINAPAGFAGRLVDIQVNGIPKFFVSNDGGNPSVYLDGAGTLFINNNSSNGVILGNYAGFGLHLGSTASIIWNSNTPASTRDLFLSRDAANTLAQRNGTNPQIYRIYNTFTGATNFERARAEWVSNVFLFGTQKGTAGGTARDMELQTDGVTRITLKADGAILFSNIPTTNPNVAGQLWNDGGTLKLSAG